MKAQKHRGIKRPGSARFADRAQTMLLVVGQCASDLIPDSQHADVWLDVCPKACLAQDRAHSANLHVDSARARILLLSGRLVPANVIGRDVRQKKLPKERK